MEFFRKMEKESYFFLKILDYIDDTRDLSINYN